MIYLIFLLLKKADIKHLNKVEYIVFVNLININRNTL